MEKPTAADVRALIDDYHRALHRFVDVLEALGRGDAAEDGQGRGYEETYEAVGRRASLLEQAAGEVFGHQLLFQADEDADVVETEFELGIQELLVEVTARRPETVPLWRAHELLAPEADRVAQVLTDAGYEVLYSSIAERMPVPDDPDELEGIGEIEDLEDLTVITDDDDRDAEDGAGDGDRGR